MKKEFNNIYKSIALVFLWTMGYTASAQSVNYSQYKDATLFVNPAALASSSELAASVIHRSQALSETLKYNTTAITFSMPLIDKKRNRRWGGWGLSVLNDEVKGGLDFRTQGLSAAYAYNLPIATNQYIGFGMQAGVYQRNVVTKGLSTSSQWLDNTGYVSSAYNGESLVDGRKNYFSLSAGMLYYKEDQAHRQTAKFGVAAFNVNKPDVSLTANRDAIPVKFTAMGSLALMQVSSMLIQGEALYYQENTKNTFHLGARASHYFDPANAYKGSLEVKAGYRVNNALTAEVQLHQPNFTIGFAYDFSIVSKESYRSANDVPEFLFTLKKMIGSAKKTKSTQSTTYTSMEKLRDFYAEEYKKEKTSHTTEQSDATEEDTALVSKGVFKLKHDFKFGFNEASLTEESKAYLDDMVALLNGNSRTQLEIIGHTDNVGSEAANQKVSMQRAQVVVDYLISKGINTARLTATAKSDKEPLVSNKSETGRALNRRVEFVVSTH